MTEVRGERSRPIVTEWVWGCSERGVERNLTRFPFDRRDIYLERIERWKMVVEAGGGGGGGMRWFGESQARSRTNLTPRRILHIPPIKLFLFHRSVFLDYPTIEIFAFRAFPRDRALIRPNLLCAAYHVPTCRALRINLFLPYPFYDLFLSYLNRIWRKDFIAIK